MNVKPNIKLYGSVECHKTQNYQLLFEEFGLSYEFLDVKQNESHAEELRGLYENKKLNFPTIKEYSSLENTRFWVKAMMFLKCREKKNLLKKH